MNIPATIAALQTLQSSQACFNNSSILALDESGDLNTKAEYFLDRLKIKSCLSSSKIAMPDLMQLLRQVCHKDLALGLGHSLTSFMASTNIWLAGSKEHKQKLIEIFDQNGAVSIAYHEPEHGNDIASNSVIAKPVDGGYIISGSKKVINNIARAKAIVLYAKTGGKVSSRQHSLFFIHRDQMNNDNFTVTKRFTPQGVRGCHIAGIDFDELFIPQSCLLGKEGFAFEYALKAFQITRTLLPGISLGTVNSALAQVIDFCQKRRLYGNNLLNIPKVKEQLLLNVANIYIAETLSESLARCLHLTPDKMMAYSAASKFFIPKLMRHTLKELAEIYGARYYLRGSLFEKIIRDYQVINFGHAGSLVCQASLAPLLPKLLKPAKTEIKEVNLWDQTLPGLDFDKFRLGIRSGDPILGSLDGLIKQLAAVKGSQAESDLQFDHILTAAQQLQHTRDALLHNLSATSSTKIADDTYIYCLLLSGTCLLQRFLSRTNVMTEKTSALTLLGLFQVLSLIPTKQVALDRSAIVDIELETVYDLTTSNESPFTYTL